jgi:hypothetical protein
MFIRQMLRTLEKTLWRPLGRKAKGLWRRCSGSGRGRVARLERRIEELEAAVRELTGLAYLRLADDEVVSVDDRKAA